MNRTYTNVELRVRVRMCVCEVPVCVNFIPRHLGTCLMCLCIVQVADLASLIVQVQF